MKILLTGSKGQVGWEFQNRGTSQGLTIIGVDIEEVDIADKQAVEELVEDVAADLVVNAAAYTDVDAAEENAAIAFKVNRDGPTNIAIACSAVGTPLIHISTDYVYGGDKKRAYIEDDPMAPEGVYAQSKAAGDQLVRTILYKHVIIRTAWVYGIHGNNFVKTMLRLGRERESISVVNDQTGCPTHAADLAETILNIVRGIQQEKKILWGTYHYCGGGQTTWYDFAKEIFKLAGPFEVFKLRKIEPIPTSEYPTPTRRPANSVLDCAKIKQAFNIVPRPWEESLADMLQRYYYLNPVQISDNQ